jgi:hypothetical protein
MKGTMIIPKQTSDFEVAHRLEAGEHHIEVAVGSSYNELYWDIPARRFVSEPDRYEGVPEVLEAHGAGWLLRIIPLLANGTAQLTSAALIEMAKLEATNQASP